MATLFAIDVGWKAILDDLGLDINRLLTASNLPFDTFEKANPKATTEQFFAMWRELEIQINHEDFSLMLGTSVSPEIFNPVIFSAICSQNFEQAMLRVQEFKLLIGPLKLCMEKTQQNTLKLEVKSIKADVLPLTYQLMECVFLVYLIQLATRKTIHPKKIGFPDLSIISNHTKKFLNTDFEQNEFCVLEFDYADTQVPFISANHAMWTFFEPQLQSQLSQAKAQQTYLEKVESILLKMIPTGQVSIEAVADNLCISKRTLQRKLKEEDCNFQEIVNHLREKLAKHYLEKTNLPNIQISFLLGFEDPNSFIRAFSHWVGQSPEAYRSVGF